MSKDLLIERLRMRRVDGTPAAHDMLAAADRIEKLEAELAISKGREDGKQRIIEQLEASLRDALTRTAAETSEEVVKCPECCCHYLKGADHQSVCPDAVGRSQANRGGVK